MTKIVLTAFAASLLASCASRTMDSVPSPQELNSYTHVVRARYQAEYNELERRRAAGTISKADYDYNKHRLDSKVNEEVNDAAWNKHFLAESERKADGVPTPDAPVALTPGQTPDSFYRPSSQNFSQATGQSGSAGLGSMRAAQEQFDAGRTIRRDATSAGGSYLSQPPPGSVYDDDRRQ